MFQLVNRLDLLIFDLLVQCCRTVYVVLVCTTVVVACSV